MNRDLAQLPAQHWRTATRIVESTGASAQTATIGTQAAMAHKDEGHPPHRHG